MDIVLKKGIRIGFLAAEEDKIYLKENFVDSGYFNILSETSDPRFIILGRTGSGKTALVDRLKLIPTTSSLNPEELSFQYLCNSNIVNYLNAMGANFDIFYKFLWKHICILELIKARYESQEDVEKSGLFDLSKFIKPSVYKKEQETKNSAKQYLEKYGDKYWISSDARIKNITHEIEDKVNSDSVLKAGFANFGLEVKHGGETSSKINAQTEINKRLNNIVHDYLVTDLNKLLELMSQNSFADKHKKYYIVIDDLDKNWMPDSRIYIDLIKTLLDTAKEINRKLTNVKIIVSVREDAFYRIFDNIKKNEPQREKWNDVILKLNWESESLKSLIEKRLNYAFKSQYTSKSIVFEDVFPDQHKKNKEISFKFLLDRTFNRPRDVIDFVNTSIDASVSNGGKITWATLNMAEKEYSIRRYDSVLDEWKEVYPNIDRSCRALSRLGSKFNFEQVEDSLIEEMMQNQDLGNFLGKYFEVYMDNKISIDEVRRIFLKTLFIMGIIGIRDQHSGNIIYSFEMNVFTYPEFGLGSSFVFHKMFRPALGLSN